MAKIGILGGTFNPIHYGHIQLGQAAINECGLDKVLVMPSGISYLKKDMVVPDGNTRMDMCRCILEEFHDNFELSDIEVNRDGNTYTYETLEYLTSKYPQDELYFIIGADSLFYIENWFNSKRVFELANIVSSNRGSAYDFDAMNRQAEYLKEKYNASVYLIKKNIVDISSTQIRDMFINKISRDEICKFISLAEYEYIVSKNIY